MYKIVTISREFGCNARGIAQKLANALNFAHLRSRSFHLLQAETAW